jgi:hypothetical protein
VRAQLRKLGNADGRTLDAAPHFFLRHVARLLIAELYDKAGHHAMHPLPVVEPLVDLSENMGDGLRRLVGIGLELERALLRLDGRRWTDRRRATVPPAFGRLQPRQLPASPPRE